MPYPGGTVVAIQCLKCCNRTSPACCDPGAGSVKKITLQMRFVLEFHRFFPRSAAQVHQRRQTLRPAVPAGVPGVGGGLCRGDRHRAAERRSVSPAHRLQRLRGGEREGIGVSSSPPDVLNSFGCPWGFSDKGDGCPPRRSSGISRAKRPPPLLQLQIPRPAAVGSRGGAGLAR